MSNIPTHRRPEPESLPPFDGEAEEAIIGSLLVDDSVFARIHCLVQPADFFRDQPRMVYEACLRVIAQGQPTDIIPISNDLKGLLGPIHVLNACAFMSRCIAQVPTSVHAEHYARIVHELAKRRRTIQNAGEMARKAYQGTDQRRAYY